MNKRTLLNNVTPTATIVKTPASNLDLLSANHFDKVSFFLTEHIVFGLVLQAYNGPNPNKSKTGAIVGGVFGVLAAAGVGVGAYFLYKQKRRGRYNPTSFVRVMD